MRRLLLSWLVVAIIAMLFVPAASATVGSDTRVSVGSPTTPFSQNKQNEPALAVDPIDPNVLAAGANDNIDLEACNAGDDTTCPFTPGVGTTGIDFSFDHGGSWIQPTYSGYSARTCLGSVGSADPPCQPLTPAQGGRIGTLPWYYENGVVSDGDPALAFGPQPGSAGGFSWSGGARLYVANLTANFSAKRSEARFKGVEGVGVSRTDNVAAAAAGDKDAWKAPVVIPASISSAAFADKEQIWADNASSSPHFGNVYVCFANYKGGPGAGTNSHTLVLARSTDGGDAWSKVIVDKNSDSSSGQFANLSGDSGCTVRTASDGTVYLSWIGFDQSSKTQGIYLATSSDGGASFAGKRRLFTVHGTGVFDPALGRLTMDGIAGARDDLSDAPSIDIANGAPTGGDATDQIVLTWVDGRVLNDEAVKFSTSTNGGATWSAPRRVEVEIGHPGDRGYYSAVAISPNGQDVYLTYNAWLEPYKDSTIGSANDRPLLGVLAHADVSAGAVGSFLQLHRSVAGDARGSSQNDLTAEFLGDYVYAVATDSYGAAVWNDVRNAADCPALDAWRMSLRTGASVTKPAPEQDCPPAFGNSDIFGGSWADPTP